MNMLEFIKSRRSTRNYQSTMVEDEKINQIVEAGRYAPSGGNSQSCQFVIVENQEVLQRLAELVQQEFCRMDYDETTYASIVNAIKCAKQGNYVFHYHAPVLIIVANKKGYGNAMADSACALENMMLMANALDLGSCWINQLHWLDENAVIRKYLQGLGIDDTVTICGALSVGYANMEGGLPPRKPLPRKGNTVTWIQ